MEGTGRGALAQAGRYTIGLEGNIEEKTTLRLLEDLAQRLGVEIRYESPWKGGAHAGGLCRVRGELVILVDASAPVVERIAVLCEALSSLDLDAVFLPPALRAKIRSRR